MLTEERTMPKELPWDGKTERRKVGRDNLTAHDEVIILQNQFLAISDRITNHKIAQDEGFRKLEASIDRIADMLVPKDGGVGLIQNIRDLNNDKIEQKKQHDTIIKIAIGSITALIISVAAWLGKGILALIKIMGG